MDWIKKAVGWTWTHLGNIVLIGSWFGAFAITAWAARAAKLFSEYGPLSWVVAGFAGLFFVMICALLLAVARRLWVRSNYDARMLPKGPLVDPMHRTFEGKRIFLNEFMLPSHPLIEGKTFVDCEIIGPANLYLHFGNRVDESQFPRCDAVLLGAGKEFNNGVILRNCTLRRCSFQRITWFVSPSEYAGSKNSNWLNWITDDPSKPELPLGYAEVSPPESLEHRPPQDTEGKTPQ
jgi:hypothetical protein